MTLIKAQTRLLLGVLAALLPALLVGVALGSDEAIQVLTAFAICTLPAMLSVAAAVWAAPKGGNWVLGVTLIGPVFRMAVALSAALAVRQFHSRFDSIGFLLWVGLAYMVTLVLEAWLAVVALQGSARFAGSGATSPKAPGKDAS